MSKQGPFEQERNNFSNRKLKEQFKKSREREERRSRRKEERKIIKQQRLIEEAINDFISKRNPNLNIGNKHKLIASVMALIFAAGAIGAYTTIDDHQTPDYKNKKPDDDSKGLIKQFLLSRQWEKLKTKINETLNSNPETVRDPDQVFQGIIKELIEAENFTSSDLTGQLGKVKKLDPEFETKYFYNLETHQPRVLFENAGTLVENLQSAKPLFEAYAGDHPDLFYEFVDKYSQDRRITGLEEGKWFKELCNNVLTKSDYGKLLDRRETFEKALEYADENAVRIFLGYAIDDRPSHILKLREPILHFFHKHSPDSDKSISQDETAVEQTDSIMTKAKKKLDEIIETIEANYENNPSMCFGYLRSILKSEEAFRLGEKMAKKYPALFFDTFNPAADISPVLDKIINTVAYSRPVATLKYATPEYISRIKESALINLFYQSASSFPAFFLEHFDKFIPQIENSKKINPKMITNCLRSAAENDPISAQLYLPNSRLADQSFVSSLIFEAKAKIDLETAKKGLAIPESIIDPDNLPPDKETFKKYLISINREHKINTTTGEIPESEENGFSYIPFEICGYDLITIPKESFEAVYFNPYFQATLRQYLKDNPDFKMSYMNSFSIAQSIAEGLNIHNNEDDYQAIIKKSNFEKMVKEESLKRFQAFHELRQVKIEGEKCYVAYMSHEEMRASDPLIREFLKDLRVPDNQILSFVNGVKISRDGENENKISYIKSIVNSKGKIAEDGFLLLPINAHGSEQNIGFDQNTPGNLNTSLEKDPLSLNYKELGDALIESGNLAKTILIIDTCYSADYLENLYDYLAEKQVQERPILAITAANFSRYGWDNVSDKGKEPMFFKALIEAYNEMKIEQLKESGLSPDRIHERLKTFKPPFTFSVFLKAESKVWRFLDPTATGVCEKIKGCLRLGSLGDPRSRTDFAA
ncbi:MAG: hypothetical protein GF347_01385 [Candidatus Moranbacteria bacterium]|nr:hypothetical protein [Candidatus Moranbacteria bacterium]